MTVDLIYYINARVGRQVSLDLTRLYWGQDPEKNVIKTLSKLKTYTRKGKDQDKIKGTLTGQV